MNSDRWSDDAFLDTLAGLGDVEADACFAELQGVLAKQDFAGLFDSLNANDEPLPADMNPVLRAFFDKAVRLPQMDGQDVDRAQLTRGEKVFMTHAFPSALVLLVKSLPEGYSAPRLSRVLALSGNLRHHPYRRLLGVLQMLINVTSVGGFESKGLAIVTAVKMRMLHAGIRNIVPKYEPEFEKEFGTPVSLEDMLGTVMGFSLLVIQGLQRMHIGLTDAAGGRPLLSVAGIRTDCRHSPPGQTRQHGIRPRDRG